MQLTTLNQEPLLYLKYEGAVSADNFEFRLRTASFDGSAGTISLLSSANNSSSINIEQYDTLEVVENIAVPIDATIAQGPPGLQGLLGPFGPQGVQGVMGIQGQAGPAAPVTDIFHATGNIDANGSVNSIIGATVTQNWYRTVYRFHLPIIILQIFIQFCFLWNKTSPKKIMYLPISTLLKMVFK